MNSWFWVMLGVALAAVLVLLALAVAKRRRRGSPQSPTFESRGPASQVRRGPPAERSGPAPAAGVGAPRMTRGDRVRFHTFWPEAVAPEVWQPLLVYMWSGASGLVGVRDDVRRRISNLASFRETSAQSAFVEKGAEIQIVPEIEGFIFNPPQMRIRWFEDWHGVEFRMKAETATFAERPDPSQARGRVSFYVGPLLIATTEIEIDVGARSAQENDDRPRSATVRQASSSPYRNIFVSYSRDDTIIVEHLEKAYRVIGDSYLRDVNILRSGELWNEQLLRWIPAADVFQLCWSQSAKGSTYVEQEWRYALNLQRSNFIRPLFWTRPMPDPPEELRPLQFSYMEL